MTIRTHEDYIKDVASFVVEHADLNETEHARLSAVKLVYGSGPDGTRGVTFYGRWQGNGQESAVPFVEVSAFGQESPIQLAGTTVHELAHVLAPIGAGHGADWIDACKRLGLQNMKAAGTEYSDDTFQPWLLEYIKSIEPPTEGQPVKGLSGFFAGLPANLGLGFMGKPFKLRGCKAGIGTRGGKSRGAGSGSRLRKYECPCGQIIRAAGTTLQVKHAAPHCKKPFMLCE